MGKEKNIGKLRPFVHDVDGKGTAGKKTVNVDTRRLISGSTPDTYRAFSTVFAPVRPGQPFKDLHEGPGGKIVPAEGPTKQTWINFGDAKRAQHYVATYAQQHIQSDLKQTFNVAQQAAEVGRIMQQRKAQQNKSEGFSSLKTALKTMEARKTPLAEPTLFGKASEHTRKKIAGQRLNAWGDTGPVIRGFDVHKQTAKQILKSSVVEDDKKVTRSKVINVDQTKAANQVGVSDQAKRHLFKGAKPGTLGSVVFNPTKVGDKFLETSGKVTSLSSFERQHRLEPTINVIARKQAGDGEKMPTPKSVVNRRGKGPKAKP